MPSITFQPVLREIKDVLKSDFYSIPRFQRPYSWSSENLEDFWRDVVEDNDEGYFVGPMVAYRIGSDDYGIVDGQQRITSVTLALCALRDLFLTASADRLANGLQKYIEREDDDDNVHFVLRSDAAGTYFKSQFQARPPRQTREPANEEQRALKKAFDEIQSWLKAQISTLSMEVADGDELSPAATRLRDIRDKILTLQVIWILLDSEDDAYVIFETLNSRGKDLETVDLLKNLILQAIKAENGDLDSARSSWAEMREILETEGNGANPNKFILHWWLSKHEYTAGRKLFRLIKKQFRRPDAQMTLSSLRDDAELYSRISNPSSWRCNSYESAAKSSLTALNLFGVRQPRPLLLALLRAYRAGDIRVAKLKAALRAIESFHYITTAVVGVSSAGGISVMYAKYAREVSNASSSDVRHASIDAFIERIHGLLPARATFLSEFATSLNYSDSKPEAKRLVQYTLQKLHDHSVKGTALDHSRCNLEHISPQVAGEPWMHSIGNLLWVDADLNAQLGHKPFHQKQGILASRRAVYDVADVLASETWTEKEATARAARLAELAYDRVWLVR